MMRQITWPCPECGDGVPIPGPDGYPSLDAYRKAALLIGARHGLENYERHPSLVARMGRERLEKMRAELPAVPDPGGDRDR